MAAANSIDPETDARSIIGMREFDAPRDLVFAAFTDPQHLAQWWGPNGFTTTTSSFDLRAGGEWRHVMHGPDGRDYQNRITFEEVVRPERIVYRHPGGPDVEPVQFRQTILFEDLGGRTHIIWRGDFPTAAERDRVIKVYGADKGWWRMWQRWCAAKRRSRRVPCRFNRICRSKAAATKPSTSTRRQSAPRSSC
jgi:uncharacterized protein YndB with AHSA1/START domain